LPVMPCMRVVGIAVIAMRLRVVVCRVGGLRDADAVAGQRRAGGRVWLGDPSGSAVPGLTSGQLSAVSCTSRTVCTASGATPTKPTSRCRWWSAGNGSTWRIQRTPHPAGAKATSFRRRVVHVEDRVHRRRGLPNKANIALPLAERWNGSAWRIQRASYPAGARSASLSGVWCTSRTGCVAVGELHPTR